MTSFYRHYGFLNIERGPVFKLGIYLVVEIVNFYCKPHLLSDNESIFAQMDMISFRSFAIFSSSDDISNPCKRSFPGFFLVQPLGSYHQGPILKEKTAPNRLLNGLYETLFLSLF